MLAGRPGPVSLEMPMDVMGRRCTVDVLPAAAVADADPDAVAAAVKLMARANAPLIIAGGGALTARVEINELAERLQAPVVTFRNGRGVVSDRSYLS